MKVLGVDPGYDRVGLAVMSYNTRSEVLHHSECFETDRTIEINDRIELVGQRVVALVEEHQIDTLAIETLFFNKNVKTAMQVAEARGVIIYAAKSAGCQVYEFSPQAIKQAVTGYGNSDKTAVISMVRQLVPNAPEAALDDEYDAIATSVTCLATHGRTQ